MLQTRIRELRKRRGLTLQQLADMIGTTAQTVQRLETANMTVSTDWLERFANAFGVHPAELIAGGSRHAPEWLGALNRDGALTAESGEAAESFTLDIPAADAVAVRLTHAIGPYPGGSILIADRLRGRDMANAHGCDCLAALETGALVLRRAIAGQGDTVTLVPLAAGQTVQYDQRVRWLGRLVMTVRYL